MIRALAVALIAAAVLGLVVALRGASEPRPEPSGDRKTADTKTPGGRHEHRLVVKLRAQLDREHRRYRRAQRRVYELGRVLRHTQSTREAIDLACVVYGSCSTLWRRADCETGGTFSPTARNPTPVGREHASGLFGFLPSTFDSTPYARFSIWSPYANALAAGWMEAHGRGGEWACR